MPSNREIAEKLVINSRAVEMSSADWIAEELDSADRRGFERALELAVREHESVDAASDNERHLGIPGAGAMGAVIEYRDRIRAIAYTTPEASDD